ncbi:MAG: twin-arginine translocase TatA/TatE family subunit [Pseudomonadales bacterium]|jgi:sec-independent protein translocase protein TatA|nr:twin-arginine translocase TatA/TatE family subunit [Pseudomonadota bacterium]MED5444256.1 twin-arginine translocase TatA/TatE family subunit [Pseudomonadota bacterium]MEE3110225.1 twin-arginine translocase TatA/TatE family subunit [Pseudomonadota bacterium]
MFGLSVTELLIILAIVLLLFGTKRLRNLGGDLGGAIKGFRKAMKEEDGKAAEANPEVLEGQAQASSASEQEKAKNTV